MNTSVIKEKIKTGAVFINGRIEPRWFLWKQRKIEIKKITFSWNTAEGASPLIHFSVTDGSTYYELSYNKKSLEWMLEKTATD